MSVKKISDILTQKGYKASESTIYSWENGNSQPTPGALMVMCKEYGIKDVLKAFGYKEDGSLQLNLNEIELIEKYRDLDLHGKDMVNIVLSKEHDRCVTIKTNKTIPLIKESDPDYLAPNVAHERTGIKIKEEERLDDENMVD